LVARLALRVVVAVLCRILGAERNMEIESMVMGGRKGQLGVVSIVLEVVGRYIGASMALSTRNPVVEGDEENIALALVGLSLAWRNTKEQTEVFDLGGQRTGLPQVYCQLNLVSEEASRTSQDLDEIQYSDVMVVAGPLHSNYPGIRGSLGTVSFVEE
jgi:hypothetical protein